MSSVQEFGNFKKIVSPGIFTVNAQLCSKGVIIGSCHCGEQQANTGLVYILAELLSEHLWVQCSDFPLHTGPSSGFGVSFTV